MATLIDTNVLVDIAVRDAHWLAWSRRQLLSVAGPRIINPIIYAEFSVRYDSPDDVDALLPEPDFLRESLPWEGAFAAGAAFRKYRSSGGSRERTLPDFLIGGHAVVRGYSILTRDPKTYRSYFPGVELIAPDTHP